MKMLRALRRVRRGKSAKKLASRSPTVFPSQRVYLSGETVSLEEEEEEENEDEDAGASSQGGVMASKASSLGTGTLALDGVIYFEKRIISSLRRRLPLVEEETSAETASISTVDASLHLVKESFAFDRQRSYFMRTADLVLDKDSIQKLGDVTVARVAHYHYPSHDTPPLHVDDCLGESWVALDNGIDGQASPVATLVVDALARTGLDAALGCGSSATMWSPQKSTEKFLARSCEEAFAKLVRPTGRDEALSPAAANDMFSPLCLPPRGSTEAQEVCLWTGSFSHGCYGSDLPLVRAVGIVDMSPEALLSLMWDSDRVREYNALSLGRTDEVHFPDGPDGSRTKIVRSLSRPPLLRKNLQLVSLMHSRPLFAEKDEERKNPSYLIVSRAVASAKMDGGATSDVIRSEMLLGVNMLRPVRGDPNRCLMINVNHVRTPTSAPIWMLRKVGLSAAVNFIQDMRNVSSKKTLTSP